MLRAVSRGSVDRGGGIPLLDRPLRGAPSGLWDLDHRTVRAAAQAGVMSATQHSTSPES
jgi:hypothetical protein